MSFHDRPDELKKRDKMKAKLALIPLAVCLVLCFFAFPRLNDSQRFSVPYEPQTAERPERLVHTALRPGERVFLKGLAYDDGGGFLHCLHWHAWYGEDSVIIKAYIYENSKWIHVSPYPLCLRGHYYEITITNIHDEPQFVRAGIIRGSNATYAGYGFESLRAKRYNTYYAPPLAKISDYPTIAEVRRSGFEYLLLAGLAGLLTVITFFGPVPVLATIFPSNAARQVRSSLAGLSDRRKTYDASANQRYREVPKSGWQRQTDIEELRRHVQVAKTDLARARSKLDELKMKEDATAAEFRAAQAEFEAGVEKAKAAQAAMERIRKKMDS